MLQDNFGSAEISSEKLINIVSKPTPPSCNGGSTQLRSTFAGSTHTRSILIESTLTKSRSTPRNQFLIVAGNDVKNAGNNDPSVRTPGTTIHSVKTPGTMILSVRTPGTTILVLEC